MNPTPLNSIFSESLNIQTSKRHHYYLAVFLMKYEIPRLITIQSTHFKCDIARIVIRIDIIFDVYKFTQFKANKSKCEPHRINFQATFELLNEYQIDVEYS